MAQYTRSVAFTVRIAESKISVIQQALRKKMPNGKKVTQADIFIAGAEAIANGRVKTHGNSVSAA